MCTVTFIARQRGYALGMNRDEKLTRKKGLPPKLRTIHGKKTVCPSEPGGGTWIALNEVGVTIALINWYSVAARVGSDPISRGEVPLACTSASHAAEVDAALAGLPLHRINPFRLIGIFPQDCKTCEWRWDLRALERLNRGWRTQQWISSGFDEPRAQRVRGKAFRDALRNSSSTRLDWLRRLHSSHTPQTGPFSTCMHRADAATVSYTEIALSNANASVRYHAGSPCQKHPMVYLPLRLSRV